VGVGPFEVLIIVSVLLLIIGPRRVTNIAKSLGRGIQDFASELGDKASGPKQSALGEGDEDDEEKSNKPSKEPGKR
jgi:Sec-independent protein translocase protein TatA